MIVKLTDIKTLKEFGFMEPIEVCILSWYEHFVDIIMPDGKIVLVHKGDCEVII